MQEKKQNTQSKLVVKPPSLEDLPAFIKGTTDSFVKYEICQIHCKVTSETFKSFFLDHLIINLHPSDNFILQDTESKQIRGGIVAGDFTLCVPNPEEPQPTNSEELPLCMKKIQSICQYLENMYIQQKGYPEKGNTIYYELVFTDRNYIKKGLIGYSLLKSLKEAKRKGYKKAMALLTSKASQKAFYKIGFKELGYFYYKDFKYEGENVFINPEEEKCTLGELVLSDLEENYLDTQNDFLVIE